MVRAAVGLKFKPEPKSRRVAFDPMQRDGFCFAVRRSPTAKHDAASERYRRRPSFASSVHFVSDFEPAFEFRVNVAEGFDLDPMSDAVFFGEAARIN